MKKFTRRYTFSHEMGSITKRWFGDLTPCVYDIETTGLSRTSDRIILTAMLIPDERGAEITQFLAESPFEEDQVLEATVSHMNARAIDYLITYNGASFDVPFTQERVDRCHLPYSAAYFDFDLYRFLRTYSILPGEIGSISQKNVEDFFGIGGSRRDIITGRESVKLFKEYVIDGSPVKEKIILTHNREDVLQLYKLFCTLTATDFTSILKAGIIPEAALGKTGLPAAGGLLTVRPRPSKGRLKVTGSQNCARLINTGSGGPFNGVKFSSDPQDIAGEFREKTSDFTADIPVIRKGDSAFADLTIFDPELDNLSYFSDLPGYVNGFLVLAEDGIMKDTEVNSLSVWVAERLRNDLLKQ